MQCPRCHGVHGKKLWMPSQWRLSNPIVPGYYNVCKICSEKAFVPSPALIAHKWDELCSILDEVSVELFRGMFRNLVTKWMDNVSKAERKVLSHQGFIEEIGDPGNWMYYIAMKMLLPELLHERGWNCETVGDIWEAFLTIKDSTQYFGDWMQRYLRSLAQLLGHLPDGGWGLTCRF